MVRALLNFPEHGLRLRLGEGPRGPEEPPQKEGLEVSRVSRVVVLLPGLQFLESLEVLRALRETQDARYELLQVLPELGVDASLPEAGLVPDDERSQELRDLVDTDRLLAEELPQQLRDAKPPEVGPLVVGETLIELVEFQVEDQVLEGGVGAVVEPVLQPESRDEARNFRGAALARGGPENFLEGERLGGGAQTFAQGPFDFRAFSRGLLPFLLAGLYPFDDLVFLYPPEVLRALLVLDTLEDEVCPPEDSLLLAGPGVVDPQLALPAERGRLRRGVRVSSLIALAESEELPLELHFLRSSGAGRLLLLGPRKLVLSLFLGFVPHEDLGFRVFLSLENDFLLLEDLFV